MTNWTKEDVEQIMADNPDIGVDDRASMIKASGDDKSAIQKAVEYVNSRPPVFAATCQCGHGRIEHEGGLRQCRREHCPCMKFQSKRKHKYNVSPKEDRTYGGITYDSKKEARYAEELDLRKRTGEISFWLRQVPFDLPGHSRYFVDFVAFYRFGCVRLNRFQDEWTVDFIEVKGKLKRKNKKGKCVETELYVGKLKRKQTEELYGIKISVV